MELVPTDSSEDAITHNRYKGYWKPYPDVTGTGPCHQSQALQFDSFDKAKLWIIVLASNIPI